VSNSEIKILVLDDDPFVLKLFPLFLAKLGFTEVAVSNSGLNALTWVNINNSSSNLIFLDLNMPDMDGIEFVRKLVDHNYAGSLILVSAEDERILQMAEKLVQAHHINILGHLRKPITVNDLSHIVRKWSSSDEKRHIARIKRGADELRVAITCSELINYYQPKVAVATGEVVGVETLVRWQHPEEGIIYPDEFISIAEQHGLIDDLTHLVLIKAMDQTKVWQQEGINLRVAINISMANLSSVKFVDLITDAVLVAGIAPQDILLEITESVLMLDQRAPLEVLTRLRMKRFRLSIDDFGTGHSSMKQLRDISFDELKIDQSFVHGAWKDETIRAMFDASLQLGKQLGMKIVAEGVEDLADWDMVCSSGCDIAQGYFIAHPMPAAELPNWVKSWNERRLQLKWADDRDL
jgi:EAL domain-containing protein (putative c-di-GMP-specific phosphodiesterase class I)/FixJ family two-component response regulator